MEAERFERRVLHSRDVGVYRDPALDRVTFREWHDRWWPTIEASREPNTVAQYECILRRHVLPELGDCRLASLEKIDLEEWIAELRARRHHVLAVAARGKTFGDARGGAVALSHDLESIILRIATELTEALDPAPLAGEYPAAD